MSNFIAAKDLTIHRRALAWCTFGLCNLVLVGLTGCRSTTDNQIDLLERELRVQEDYIYELEGYVVDYSEKLRDCRGCSPSQTAVYSEEVYQPAPASSGSKNSRKSGSSRSKKEKSIVEKPQEDLPSPPSEQSAPDVSPEDMEVPEIEFEMEDPLTDADDEDEFRQVAAVELDYRSADGESLVIPDPVDFAEELTEEIQTVEAETEDTDLFDDAESLDSPSNEKLRVAERLEVKHLFRGGDQTASGQNLLTVVEALDGNNEPVDLNGEVSLMVMTPGNAGQLKRIKRWNFTSEETMSAWQSSDLGDGLHLELPLEEVRLPKTALELWARLVTADGRKLLTKLPFEPQLLGGMGDNAPQPQATDSELAQAEPSLNPLRNAASHPMPADEKLQLANQESSTGDTRWRSSKKHMDHLSEGFSTTASKSNGWTKQAPGRLSYQPAKVADRSHSSTQSSGGPSWSAGR